MCRSQWKKFIGWLGKQADKPNLACIGLGLLIAFRPEPLELWLREYAPIFKPDTFAYYVLLYLISLAAIYILSMPIKYLRKKITPSQ